MGRGERGGEEEGSGDSEQATVLQWNVLMFRIRNIARDLLVVDPARS